MRTKRFKDIKSILFKTDPCRVCFFTLDALTFTFLFAGIAIFGSAFFTALSDGVTSAIMAFLRTLVFQVAAVMILPKFFELDGVWFSIIVAEVMAAAITVFFLVLKRKKYKYW